MLINSISDLSSIQSAIEHFYFFLFFSFLLAIRWGLTMFRVLFDSCLPGLKACKLETIWYNLIRRLWQHFQRFSNKIRNFTILLIRARFCFCVSLHHIKQRTEENFLLRWFRLKRNDRLAAIERATASIWWTREQKRNWKFSLQNLVIFLVHFD